MFYEPGVQVQFAVTSEPRLPHIFRGHLCIDCQAPISPYSRGRCRLCGYVGLKRNVPEDLAVILRKFGSSGAARHYKASLGTVTRWRREIGMRPQERARKPSSLGVVRPRGFAERPLLIHRDFTAAGQAADFLRRFGSVYRCDENGKANSKGLHWRRNLSVLTDERIMHTATRLGWVEFE